MTRIQFSRCKRFYPYIPGAICNFKNFECTSYYAHLGKHLLNKDYEFVLFGEFSRKKYELMSRHGTELFIRPNSGTKIFTGKLFDGYDKTTDIDKYLSDVCQPETLLVVSSKKIIEQEFRVVLHGTNPITGSMYHPDLQKLDSNHPVFGYINSLNLNWTPDIMWCMDIATVNAHGQYKILEINSFSCAGFYKCDMEIIVSTAKQVAINDFQEYN